ncbi:hypothetical protein GCM10020000_87760 [Streptomyces olivoverticillatus]
MQGLVLGLCDLLGEFVGPLGAAGGGGELGVVEGEQVGHVRDVAAGDQGADVLGAEAVDVELVAPGGVEDRGGQTARGPLGAAPPLLALVDVAAAVRARLGEDDGLLVAGAQLYEGASIRGITSPALRTTTVSFRRRSRRRMSAGLWRVA